MRISPVESGEKVDCKKCSFFINEENISYMSKVLGYTGECSKTGVLFNIENVHMHPAWCPLSEDNNIEEKL